ncbi:S8 family peptidase [Niabella drilacis]|uniref:Subtilase family protein n=1 Tax=Niabella drilacis (strain DSM 25811 / CCM 8410 / CCUG 62505 / LMG 26954 / E90) TaxID=1285928 RepID=A0A1G6Q7C5_NIADE|nr:S8 family peptidase [Niabella drilacis]SDC87616.1 Subtilase family protein [Niabella drilacis]
MIKELFRFTMGLCIGLSLYSCQKRSALAEEVPASVSAASNKQSRQQARQDEAYIPGQVLVKFKNGASAKTKGNILAKLKGKYKNKLNPNAIPGFEDEGGIDLIETSVEVLSAIEHIKNDPDIDFVEPNYIYHTTEAANDPYFTNAQWNMQAGGYGCQASTAWTNHKTGASNVYVGVVDQGYMYQHEDLAHNAGVNPGEIPGNGVDDDKNGYIDDVYGWNFYSNDAVLYNGTDYHGTHVAGIIGAEGGNGIGVAGVVWNVKLLGAKFMDGRIGNSFAAVQAIDYMVALKIKQKLNIVALCCSWEGSGSSKNLEAAIKRAGKAGILIIAAAGNSSSNNDKVAVYPANYKGDNIISVASINQAGGLSYFSNYGTRSVDIAAPGESITSTYLNNAYAGMSGTSMAAPHVAGAAALYASTHPGAGMKEIKNAILSAAIPTPSLTGKCVTGGRLDISKF